MATEGHRQFHPLHHCARLARLVNLLYVFLLVVVLGNGGPRALDRFDHVRIEQLGTGARSGRRFYPPTAVQADHAAAICDVSQSAVLLLSHGSIPPLLHDLHLLSTSSPLIDPARGTGTEVGRSRHVSPV
jgi:hypothetical protein